MSIKHGIKIQRHNFPPEWVMQEPQPGPIYYPGKVGGGGYQLNPGVPVGSPSPWTQPPPLANPTPPPCNWRPATFVDERHPKIQTMMEPLLTKFRGRCLASNLLTESGKWFDSLPQLEAYPNGICWLHSIALCPYGVQCTFAGGHLPKGTLTDAQANEVVAALQAGVTAMVNRAGPPSLTGKCKYSRGGKAEGWEVRVAYPRPPSDVTGAPPSHSAGGGGELGVAQWGLGV
jgi:hypothetical protein